MRNSPSGAVVAERELGPAPNAGGEGAGSDPGPSAQRKEVFLGDAELREWDGDLRDGLGAAEPAGAGAELGIPAPPCPAAQSQATLPVYTV